MTLPFLAAWFYFDLFSEFVFSRWLYGATKVFTVLWPVVAVKLILREPWPALGLTQARHARALGGGVISGVLIVGLMFLIWQTPVGDVVRGSAESIRRKTEDLGVLDHYWAFGCFIAFLHSFIEEYYWRWFVYGHLRRLMPVAAAHVVAGIAFAAHHVIITTQYFPFDVGFFLGSMVGVGGIIWSWLYQRQRTLAGAWISHVLVDLGILSIGYKLLFGTWV
jgi:membrane protease YdiL (CAAX protease family)